MTDTKGDALREARITDEDVYNLSFLLVPERPTASQEHRIRTVMNAIFKRMLEAALSQADASTDDLDAAYVSGFQDGFNRATTE